MNIFILAQLIYFEINHYTIGFSTISELGSSLLDDLFLLKNAVSKIREIIKQMNSDTAVVIQIPLPPNKKVRTNKLIVTITKPLPKDMMAEDTGLSIATKKPEIIKLNPKNKKDIAYCLNTDTVLLNNSISFGFINKDVILFANDKDTENTVTEVIRTVLSPNLSK